MINGGLVLLSGLRLLLSRAELRAVLWRMLMLLLVLMLVLGGGVFWLLEYVAALWIPQGDAWYWQLVAWMVWVLAFLLAVLCGMIIFVTLGSAVSAPWLNVLAMRTETIAGKPLQEPDISWWPMMLQSLANSVRPLLILLLWGAVALAFFWLPPLATAIWTYGAMRFLSFELIDTTASRRGWDYAERKAQLLEQRWFYVGFSGLAILLLLLPVVNLLVIPAAVVGLSKHMASQA